MAFWRALDSEETVRGSDSLFPVPAIEEWLISKAISWTQSFCLFGDS